MDGEGLVNSILTSKNMLNLIWKTLLMK